MTRRIHPTGPSEAEHLNTEPGDALVPEEAVVLPVAVVKRHEPDPVEVAKLPLPKLYRVMRESRVMYGGVPAIMKAGKTVSDATHDMHSLRAQGIILEEVPYGS